MKSRSGIRALALAVVVGCMWVAPHTASAQPIRIVLPLAFQETNPCNGEYVNITGTQDSFFYIRQDIAGGTQVTLRIKNQGTGQGAGVGSILPGSYGFHSEESFKFNDLSSGTTELTALTKIMMIRQSETGVGTEDDFVLRITLHLTVNPNGTVTAFQGLTSITCR